MNSKTQCKIYIFNKPLEFYKTFDMLKTFYYMRDTQMVSHQYVITHVYLFYKIIPIWNTKNEFFFKLMVKLKNI